MAIIRIDFPANINLSATVRGAKQPLMIGPTEALWATRTPDGTGSLSLRRRSDTVIEAEAWGDGADWLLRQAPRLLGSEDSLDGFTPPRQLRDQWLRSPFRVARTDRLLGCPRRRCARPKVQTTKARESRRRLCRTFGETAPGPNGGWILPAPETVANLGYADFHQLGVERKRADTLIRVAREMRRLDGLTEKAPAQVSARLQAIRGIGPWTAAGNGNRYGRRRRCPLGDFHIPNNVSWFWPENHEVTMLACSSFLPPSPAIAGGLFA
ncbi:MAG: hypothetical protein R2706_16455 [Acidimicrobiales bacterium]